MRTLVLCDDRYHPAATVREGLAPLEQHGFLFDYLERGQEWTAERMQGYDAVLLSKMNHNTAEDWQPWVDAAAERAFRDYVRGGKSLLVIHSGSAGYEEQPILRELMGGLFLHHPPQCAVTVEPRAGHPLTAGAEPFTATDEHYFMAFDDAAADVFLTASSEHGTQPAGWTRREGAGRVCLLTPGHNLEVWLQPAYQTIIAHALRWCHRV